MSSAANNLPKTYKSMIQKTKGEAFEWVDTDLKHPEPEQVLIKVLACGVCHSDCLVKYEVMPILPRVPGHEVVGEVVAVGDRVHNIKVGERVGGGWHGYHCNECASCRRGDFGTCSNEQINGVTRDGGYAEYCTLWANAAVKIPEGIDAAEAAPLLCAGVTVYNSMRNMGKPPGSLVAIQGLGGLGHLALQYASKMGYKVAALSSSDKKRDFASKLGAAHYLDASQESQVEGLNKLGGADLIVCTAPSSKVISELVNGLAVNGILLILAVPEGPLDGINVMPMIQKRLQIRGWPSGTAVASEDTVQFALDHGVNCMIEKFPLEDADKAFKHMESGDVRFRAVLIPSHK